MRIVHLVELNRALLVEDTNVNNKTALIVKLRKMRI